MERIQKPLLEVSDLSVSFRMYDSGLEQKQLPVISSLSLKVLPGEILAVAGSSGSGKSLLASAILGILPGNATVSGSLRFDGEPLTPERQAKLRGTEIALVPQSVAFLDPLMKVGAQVDGHRKPRPTERRRKLFCRFGLPEQTERLYPFQLSGGMARRVLVSTALLTSARLIIADEPTPGMSLEQAEQDFAFLDALPGRKILLKGNHDYWWTTAAKMERFFAEHGFSTLEILHNNCRLYGELALCGTRGWFYEEDRGEHSAKIFNRELMRLEASLKAAGEREKYCFLHYPPLYQGYRCQEILDLLEAYGVRRCFYGHLHGGSHRLAISGQVGSVEYRLIAADYLGFRPEKLLD